jgi:hypothetical protein
MLLMIWVSEQQSTQMSLELLQVLLELPSTTAQQVICMPQLHMLAQLMLTMDSHITHQFLLLTTDQLSMELFMLPQHTPPHWFTLHPSHIMPHWFTLHLLFTMQLHSSIMPQPSPRHISPPL